MTTYMNKTMMRFFAIALLMMVSIGAGAEVKVIYGEKGTELQADKDGTITIGQKEGLTGGTIVITQVAQRDGTTKVTLAVTPSDGYTLAKDGLEVYAVAPADISSTRAVTASDKLDLTSDDFKDTSSKRTYTTSIDSNLALWLKSASFQPRKREGAKGQGDVTYTYYALHANGKGYMKQCKGVVYNDNTFRYENAYDGNGSSMWVYSSEGYLQQEMYYLNVINGKTLVLSTTPETKWELVDDGTKKRFQMEGSTKILGYNSGSYPILDENPTNKYAACTLTVTEEGSKWEGPKDVSFTVQSPQLVTYLRTYYMRNITVTIDKNDAGTENAKVVDKKDSRCYCSLTYKSTTHSDYGSKWNINTTTGVIYTTTGQVKNVAATYEVAPLNPIVKAAHHATDQTVTLTLNEKSLAPNGTKKYLLFNTQDDNYRFLKATTSLSGDDLLPVNGKKAELTEDVNEELAWDVEVDDEGYYSFKNVATGRYFYYDATDYTVSDYGAVKIGSTDPGTDTRYKFRLYGCGNRDPFGGCQYIIPFEKQFAVFKSGGTVEELPFALYMNTSNSTKIASIVKAGDNAKWKLYTYEWQYRLWSNYTIDGEQVVDTNGEHNYTATTWFSRNIKDSPTNSDYCLLPGSKTKEGITYTWELTGLDDYVTTTDALSSGISTLTATVNLPPSTRTGTLKVTARITTPANINNNTSILIALYNLSPTFTEISSLSAITDATGLYKLTADVSYATPGVTTFSGTLDGDGHTISGLSAPLFNTLDGATVRNLFFDNVNISSGTNVGAVCGEATGATRIYNCGVLGSLTETKDDNGIITSIHSSSKIGGTGYVGSIVGKLDENSRVINCYSFAEITGGSTVAGIVGFHTANKHLTQDDINTKPMVMNCMFYGDITGGTNKFPVYGGRTGDNDMIKTDNTKGVNPYNYFRADALFDNGFTNINDYKRSWPAEEEYLTRFEYYRSILNSNRHLCTYWVTGKKGTEQTAADTALIAKWVLDPSIAPYPILKKWGKYPSIINPDPSRTWRPKAKDSDGNLQDAHWVTRSSASDYEGKTLGTLSVTVKAGSHHAGSKPNSTTLTLPILDMDTLNCDYSYAKVQLPYYNEVFGDPTASASEWNDRYGGNYGVYVVTGWKVNSVDGSTTGTGEFKEAWEDGYNFADRSSTKKDIYGVSKRVFAQGGYYYVPKDVSSIEIEAYWGKAVYLRNTDNSIDRVNVTNGGSHGSAFAPAGALPSTINGQTVKTGLREAIKALDAGNTLSVYDNAVVLVGNYQKQNKNDLVGYGIDNKWHPFTIMSADFDLDNEPDFCMQWQFRSGTGREIIQPIRFDFLPVVELGIAIRHDNLLNTIGVFVPQGHFEITETAFMHTTQFEYDASITRMETQSPLILNGGHFEQIVVRYGNKNRTSYILMGGHFRMKRFTPGYHAQPDDNGGVRHCAVNAIGGEYPEFYLSGIYRPDKSANTDNPHCYTNGGRFGIMAGAGYEQVKGDVTFKIDHSIIDEFYGGGINGSKPVTGSIDVTIDNSLVTKYCGGPKVGVMSSGKTVTTKATGTTFGVFYGGGNGGTNNYREQKKDGTESFPSAEASKWDGFSALNPINLLTGTKVYDDGTDKKGYHAEYEFEIFKSSNGISTNEDVKRAYYRWAQFGTTTTGNVSNTLTDCTVTGNFYGGGNLANVTGDVESLLNGNTHVYGSVFGAGFSASVPSFRVHDKSTVKFPEQDFTGTITEKGTIDYVKNDDGTDRYFTWSNEKPTGVSTDSPTFEKDGKWYCYTTVSLENLGTVTGDISLTIDGNSIVDHNVFGGGDASETDGSTTVTLNGNTEVRGNVFGGGNNGLVSGSTMVNIEQ